MLGKRSDQRGLFEADTVYLDFVGRDSPPGSTLGERIDTSYGSLSAEVLAGLPIVVRVVIVDKAALAGALAQDARSRAD